ncbi:MAG: alpha-hydroxy-acid oxidizing protein [Leptospirales bacterium]
MRDFLRTHKIPQPDYAWSDDKESLRKWMNENNFRHGYVIKPVRNMGSRGVMHLQNSNELAFGFEFALSFSLDPSVIVEEYVPGSEYSIDVLCHNKKTWCVGLADREIERAEDRFFVETGHNMPSAAPPEIQKEIIDIMDRFAASLSTLGDFPYQGPLKGDIRERENGEIIVGEIASRLSGGFMSTHTYPLATGIDLMDTYLNLLSLANSTESNTGSFSEKKFKKVFNNSDNELYKKNVIERALIAEPGILEKIVIPENLETFSVTNSFVHYSQGEWISPVKNNIGKTANFIIVAKDLETARENWSRLKEQIIIETAFRTLSKKEIRKESKKKFNPAVCWVCVECDGIHCASGVPGMGGAGNQETFRKNSLDLKKIVIEPSYIQKESQKNRNENTPPDLSLQIFGQNLKMPVLGAPITGAKTNLGSSITEYDYAMETSVGLANSGSLAMFGDGASADKYFVAMEAISRHGGIFIAKPRLDQDEILKRASAALEAGATAWGIDIDSVGIQTFRNRKTATSRKTESELAELKNHISLPFIVKGIMTINDADLACKAGAHAIVVSNHGGRILDMLPSTVSVLPEIAKHIKQNYPEVVILADGGIRTGSDIFKMISLGADAVLIGRPLAIATIAFGRFGAESLFRNLKNELESIMVNLGIADFAAIRGSVDLLG